MLGFCFGHQLIAQALGGQVSKSEKGWGLGTRMFKVLRNETWMTPTLEEMTLLYSHQDQVTQLPPQATALGTSEFCPNEMFSIENHIFCMQGHPEFDAKYSISGIESRKSILDTKTFDQSKASSLSQTNSPQVSQWLRQFLSS